MIEIKSELDPRKKLSLLELMPSTEYKSQSSDPMAGMDM
jgi:hypothetical protein